MPRPQPEPDPAPAPRSVLASPHDLLKVTEVVGRLGMRRPDAEAWLGERGLVRVVIWGDVLACIRMDTPSPIDGGESAGGRNRRGRAVEARLRPRMTDAF